VKENLTKCVANNFVSQSSYVIKRSADITDNVVHVKSCHLSRNEQQQVCCRFAVNNFFAKLSTAVFLSPSDVCMDSK